MDLIDKRINKLETELNNTIVGSQDAMDIVDELDRLKQIKNRDSKLLGEQQDAKRQGRQRVLGTICDMAKPVIGGVITIGAIALVGAFEKETILSQKLISIATKVFPRVF